MNFELQFLKAGAALCGKVFPNFVATWNWLVNFCSNMKGDADVDDVQGRIKVDFADPNHPIIRCAGCNVNGGGSGDDEEDGDDEEGGTACVTSLNYETGDMNVIGGRGIEVSTDGQTIKVTWNKDKEDEDEDPNAEKKDPCEHDDDGGETGGVYGGDVYGGGISGGGDEPGGVAADGSGDIHPGDDNCNCD